MSYQEYAALTKDLNPPSDAEFRKLTRKARSAGDLSEADFDRLRRRIRLDDELARSSGAYRRGRIALMRMLLKSADAHDRFRGTPLLAPALEKISAEHDRALAAIEPDDVRDPLARASLYGRLMEAAEASARDADEMDRVADMLRGSK